MAESGYDPALANLHCISHNGFNGAACKLEKIALQEGDFKTLYRTRAGLDPRHSADGPVVSLGPLTGQSGPHQNRERSD